MFKVGDRVQSNLGTHGTVLEIKPKEGVVNVQWDGLHGAKGRVDSMGVDYLQKVEEQDNVNHPRHYTSHPSGIECIEVVEHMPFCVGSAMKYLWRAGLKNDELEDLKKARWYVEREIARREKGVQK